MGVSTQTITIYTCDICNKTSKHGEAGDMYLNCDSMQIFKYPYHDSDRSTSLSIKINFDGLSASPCICKDCLGKALIKFFGGGE